MKLKYNIHILIVIVFSLFFANMSFSSTIDKITIKGNERITAETIKTFLPVNINDNVNEKVLNNITKELYETNFFNNVTVSLINNELIIKLSENPIVQNVVYNGIKSESLRQFITSNVKLRSRSSYVELFLKEDVVSIIEKLKLRGYYFANIETQLELLDDNKLNLIYNIDLGDKAKIKKISFIGNKIFKDKRLKGIILSEESKLWKFISSKKFLNEELVNFDKRLLKNFYLNNGYYNVQISSSFAKITNNNSFELIYNIDSGEKIFFNDLSLELPVDYDKNDFSKLEKTLIELKGKPYSLNSIDKILNEIDLLVLYEEYETIDVIVNEKIKANRLNLNFQINETDKILIQKINILGNNITRENVIRNQFEIDEGDFYNKILYNKTLNNIKSLNFFKNVNGEISEDQISGDKIIDIVVEEKSTGEIGASAGVGTSGNSIGVFVKENNYLGKGIGLQSSLDLSEDSIRGVFSINNPNFNDTDKSVYTTLESSEIDKLETSGYKTSRTGFSYGTSFEILDDFNFGIGNKNYYQNIETDSTASSLQQKQKGDYWDSFLNLDFTYDKRNQKFKTSDGFKSTYSIELPLISDTNTLSNIYDYQFYTELFNDNITTLSFYAKTSSSISNDDIKLTERNFLPSRKLRGFKQGGIGPKDGNDFIGGNYASSINFSSTLPQILQENQNIDFLFFIDVGNVWGVDYSSSISDSNIIRSSAGVGVDWFTPIGPLNFSLAQPINKADTDSTETFRFNLGTTF